MEEQGLAPESSNLRSVVYCVLPADLADELHDPLRAFYRGDPLIQVIVERRGQERRQRDDRRRDAAALAGKQAEDRRRLRSATGRRIAERRAALVPAAVPDLPPIAAAHAARIAFHERLEPSTLQREDADTAKLIIRLQAGEHSLFDELYMRYFDRVYAYLKVTLQDSHEAEDVTQDVFVRVLEALPRYERRTAPFRAWMFRIVRNCAITRIRQRQRVTVEAPEEVADRSVSSVVPSADSLRWLGDDDLLSLIDELPLAQRQVIVLRYMMEFRSTEIGEIIDRSPEAVRQLHQRAMSFLRRRIEPTKTADCRSGQTRVQRESMVRLPPRAPVTRARQLSLR
jgi:RNA polymerase sigma-70 factor (ECF subfamily)